MTPLAARLQTVIALNNKKGHPTFAGWPSIYEQQTSGKFAVGFGIHRLEPFVAHGCRIARRDHEG